MKKAIFITLLLVLVSLAFSWDLLRQAQFPTNFYALDRVGTTFWAAGYVGGFAKSIDNGNTWEFVPSPAYDPVTPAYKDINDIDFYDELHGMMVSADGLVGITADGGASWTTPTQTQTIFGTDDVNACVYLPDGKIWIAGWGGKIAYSADHGVTWTQQTSGLTDQIYSITVNAAGTGFCALNRGTPNQTKILTTTDFGTTWNVQNLTVTGNPHLYKVHQYGSTVVLAGSLGYIGVSYDNGLTWTHHANAGGTSTNMQDIVLDGNTGYAVGWNGVLLRTANAFTTFETVTNDFGLYFEGINILPNGDLMAAGWNGSIAMSTDQGVSWTDKIANAVDLYSSSVVDENTWYHVGDKGYIIKTTDGGLTFDRLHIPNSIETFYSTYFKTALEGLVSGRTQGKIYRTTDGGVTWIPFTLPGVTTTQIYYEFSFPTALVGYAVGSNNIHAKTTDGGVTWTMMNGTGLGTSVLYSTFFKTELLGFAGSSAGNLYITQDGGVSWAPITVGSSAQIRDIWFKDANIGVLVNSVGEIYYTSNGGMTAGDWTAATESCLDDMNGVWCDEHDVFWAAGYSSDNTSTNIGNSWSLIKSVDNGATWTEETFPALT
ncbi:MAG: YCF48-related protein, partial [Candidatus Cloacimonadaceae bacterium]